MQFFMPEWHRQMEIESCQRVGNVTLEEEEESKCTILKMTKGRRSLRN